MKIYLLLAPLVLALQGCAIDDYITKRSTPQPSVNAVPDCSSLQAQIDQMRMENQTLRAELAQVPSPTSSVQPAPAPVKPVPAPPPAIKVTPPLSNDSPSPSSSQKTYSSSGTTYQPQTSYKAPSIVPSTRSYSTGNWYYRGPRGGCYTYSSSGRKRYVDRSLCN